ncbi:hypothetical protein Bbelb_190810 [Branchiostoma belcheri]|nr:hypothetical protein Bbelb_190810 [Branchiostoma belcheri]
MARGRNLSRCGSVVGRCAVTSGQLTVLGQTISYFWSVMKVPLSGKVSHREGQDNYSVKLKGRTAEVSVTSKGHKETVLGSGGQEHPKLGEGEGKVTLTLQTHRFMSSDVEGSSGSWAIQHRFRARLTSVQMLEVI